MTIQTEVQTPKHSLLGSLTRSQISSAVATGLEYVLILVLVEYLKVWYVLAVAMGAASGAITNFMINRHWSFRSAHREFRTQALRYAWVSALSLVLNTGGVYLVTEYAHVHYFASVVAVSLIVGLAFNFPMHRYYVFK